jgi:hypothetical protein
MDPLLMPMVRRNGVRRSDLSFLAGAVPQVGIALARAHRTKDYHRTIGMCRIDRDLYIACGAVTSTGPGSRVQMVIPHRLCKRNYNAA